MVIPMRCNTCTNSVYAPYRVYSAQGKVLEGCVDACHTDHLTTPGESARWHNRPQAKAIRRVMLKGQQGKGYEGVSR